MVYKGLHGTNEGAPLVKEYLDRKRLAELGYTTPTSSLSAKKADAFLLISSQIDKLKSDDMKKQQRKAKNGRS